MSRVGRRRTLDAVGAGLGPGLVLLSFYLTYRTFGPVDSPGHVDGRGFLSHLVVPPVGYVLLLGDPASSRQLSTYRVWFAVALLVGVVAGVSDLRSWWAPTARVGPSGSAST